MQFKYYPAERLKIDSISSRLTEEEKSLRKWLMNYTIDNNKPYNIKEDQPQKAFNSSIPSTSSMSSMVDRLVQKNAVVFDAQGDINFIYPVSALPTNHKVALRDGRKFSAMCAIDAMGVSFTFEQDITIDSKCSECGEPISVQIRDGKIVEFFPEDTHVLHVDLNGNENWSGSC